MTSHERAGVVPFQRVYIYAYTAVRGVENGVGGSTKSDSAWLTAMDKLMWDMKQLKLQQYIIYGKVRASSNIQSTHIPSQSAGRGLGCWRATYPVTFERNCWTPSIGQNSSFGRARNFLFWILPVYSLTVRQRPAPGAFFAALIFRW